MVTPGPVFRLVTFALLQFYSARVGGLGIRYPLHATGGRLTLLLFSPESDMQKRRNTVSHFLQVGPLRYFFAFGYIVSPHPDWIRELDALEGTHAWWSKYSGCNGPEIFHPHGSIEAVLPTSTRLVAADAVRTRSLLPIGTL